MAQTIRKCPVFILAFVVAMALTLTMGLGAQKAYASDDEENYPHLEFHFDQYQSFYADTEYGVTFDLYEASECDFEIKFGFREDPDADEGFDNDDIDYWNDGWQTVFTEEEGYYSVDKNAKTVTMHGPKIWEAVEQYYSEDETENGVPMLLAARLVLDGKSIYNSYHWVNIHPIDAEYFTEDYDGKMLVG